MPRASSNACNRPTSGSSASVSTDANALPVVLLLRKPVDALRPRTKFELAILSFSALVDAIAFVFVFNLLAAARSFDASDTLAIFGAVCDVDGWNDIDRAVSSALDEKKLVTCATDDVDDLFASAPVAFEALTATNSGLW